MLEIIDRLHHAFFNQDFWVALVWPHAAPNLGNQQADVVANLKIGTNVSGRCAVSAQIRQDHRHQARVEIERRH